MVGSLAFWAFCWHFYLYISSGPLKSPPFYHRPSYTSSRAPLNSSIPRWATPIVAAACGLRGSRALGLGHSGEPLRLLPAPHRSSSRAVPLGLAPLCLAESRRLSRHLRLLPAPRRPSSRTHAARPRGRAEGGEPEAQPPPCLC